MSSGFTSPGHRSLESGNGSTRWALTASAAETQEGGRHSGSRTARLIAAEQSLGRTLGRTQGPPVLPVLRPPFSVPVASPDSRSR